MKRTPVFSAGTFKELEKLIYHNEKAGHLTAYEGALLTAGRDAEKALDKLIADMPVVYGATDYETPSAFYISNTGPVTHTARLFDVRKIEKKSCEVHEPIFSTEPIKYCKHCRAKLKAKWETV